MTTVPSRARIVIIGGGVGGTSIAYHLAERGETDIVIVDRAELTSGSTFHSAGLVGQLRSSLPLTRMMMHSVEVYRRLHAESSENGYTPGWHEVGSLRIAATPERLDELRRQFGWAKTFGLPMEMLSPEECRSHFPLMSLDGVLGGVFLPTDGYLDPSGLAYSFAAAARRRGVTVCQGARVTGVIVRDDRCRGVVTDHGTIEAEVVVAACGMYTPQVAALAGVNVPIVPMAHQYLVTEPIEGVDDSVTQLRDPDNLVYFRREGQGLLLGGYERNPMPWSLHGVPEDFNHKLLPDDWDRFTPLMANAVKRVPAVEGAGIVKLLNGPEGFTPDNDFILGESEVHGFYVAAGFCAHGIAGAGGIGRVMAEWILDGEPTFDVWRMDIRRFGPQYRSREFSRDRVVEVYSSYYDIHYPNEERHAGRPLRRSPAYDRLAALGCSFGEKSMWERPNWFEPNAMTGDETLRPRGWSGHHWSPAIGCEALACTTTATLFDETSFSKIEAAGPSVVEFLQRVCANDVDAPIGSIVYTQLCNDRGGIECDLTVTRLAERRYLLVTGTAFGAHDLGWLRKQQQALPEGDGTVLTDVTSAYACFGMWGPSTRELLQPHTTTPLDNATFPYLTAQRLNIGPVPLIASRVTYVGELGWELYVPSEYGAALWDLLWEAGRGHGLVAGGYRAIDALRVEKAYRAWGSDISPEDTPYHAGLGFAVKLDKGDFVGREALAQVKSGQLDRRLRTLLLADRLAVTQGSEPVRVDGAIVGRVTSGGFGFRIRESIAFAYLPAATAAGQAVEVEVFGEWISARVQPRDAVFDPAGTRIRA